MRPLSKRGLPAGTHGLIVAMCCSHKLLKFAPYIKGTSLVFWGVIQTCHAFLLFGVEAGVILDFFRICILQIFRFRFFRFFRF